MNSTTPSSPERGESSNSVQAVVFALRILEYMATRKEAWRVTDLAAHFGTNKTRIFRHLRTLVESGYIVQDAGSERYRLGSRLIALGQTVARTFDVSEVVQPAMQQLRDQLNHSVVFSVPAANGMSVVWVEPSTRQYEITVRPGSIVGFHVTAQGKVALAFGDAARLASLDPGSLTASTPATITDIAVLRDEVEHVRKRAWAAAPDQAVVGLNAMSTPILDASSQLIGTVTIVNMTQFLPARPRRQDVRALLECGRTISDQLGYRGTVFDQAISDTEEISHNI